MCAFWSASGCGHAVQVDTFSFSQGAIASQVGLGVSQTGSGVSQVCFGASQVFASCLHLHLLCFL